MYYDVQQANRFQRCQEANYSLKINNSYPSSLFPQSYLSFRWIDPSEHCPCQTNLSELAFPLPPNPGELSNDEMHIFSPKKLEDQNKQMNKHE